MGGGKKCAANLSQILLLDAIQKVSKNYPCKLSIVVPVYNVEKYVKRCLSSILNQNVDKSLYEVIIVNDGSTDNSLAIVNETIAGYTNVFVKSTENFGQSAARNNGTQFARGEYIWYIDSDDWIEPGSIKTLLPYMDGQNDIIQFGKLFVYSDGTKRTFHRIPSSSTGREALLHGDWYIGAQFSVYKRIDTDNNVQFKFFEGIYHEDNEFTPRILHNANKVIVIDKPLYNHFQGNPTSTMTKPNIKKCYDLLTVSQRHVKYANRQCDKEVKTFFLTLASLELNTSLTNLRIYSDNERERYIKEVENRKADYIVYLLDSGKIRYRIMAFVCLLSVKSWYILLKLRKIKTDKKKVSTLSQR